MVSQINALRLGFDVLLDEPEFTISIVGSGGVLNDIPGFFVEEFTIEALGGSVTANNVPVIVLDVVDPSDPGNVVSGIVGTNLFDGRNHRDRPEPVARWRRLQAPASISATRSPTSSRGPRSRRQASGTRRGLGTHPPRLTC